MTVIITPKVSDVYRIDVVTPKGDRWELDHYQSLTFHQCIGVANQLHTVLHREQPFRVDPKPMREFWKSLVATDIDPAACVVEIVRRADAASESAPNGYQTVVVVQPVSETVR